MMSYVTHQRWLAGLLLLAAIGFSGYYWWKLLESHQELRATTMASANRRALQLADAKAAELDALLLGIDSSLRQFRRGYMASDKATATAIAQSALRAYPEQSIRFFSIVDANGNLVFTVPATEPRHLGDRDYFSHHRRNGKDELLIDKPVMAKRDGAWTVMVSRPILIEQRFAGVAVVGLSVDYLADRLAELEVGEDDVISVFFSDGAFLARSRDWVENMGKVLPPDRPFLGKDAPPSGVLRVEAISDQQRRIYAWQQLDASPLVLVVGLGEQELFGPVNRSIEQSLRDSVVANLAILFLVAGVGGLMLSNARRQARVLASETLLRSTLNSTYDGIVVVDAADRVLDANQQFLDLMGFSLDGPDQRGACVGKSFDCLYEQLADPEEFRRQRREHEGEQEIRWDAVELKSGRILEAYKKVFDLNGESVRLWCFRDITERRRYEQQLQEMATTDALTGLPNRRSFMSRLQEEIERTHRIEGHRTAFLLLDIDHFKTINDTHGHVAGDAVLRTFAALLKKELRQIDMAGRLGGEEFGVILANADAQAAMRYAERLRETVRQAVFGEANRAIPVTTSVGLTLIGREDAVPDDVLGRADEALYRAKDNGRNRVEVALLPTGAAKDAGDVAGGA